MRFVHVILLIILPLILKSQVITFNGGGDSISWYDPLNWSTGSIPSETSLVRIDPNFNVVFPSDSNTLVKCGNCKRRIYAISI